MKKTFRIISLGAFLFTINSYSSAYAAESAEFQGGSDCNLKKYVDKKWQSADATEVAGKSYSLQPLKANPKYSSFNVGGVWYSAPAKCFGGKGESSASKESSSSSGSSELESEFMHQTKAGVIELTPSFNYHSQSQTTIVGSAITKASGMTFSAMPEYGINKIFSVGLNLEFSSDSTTTAAGKTTASGLNDPSLFFNGSYQMGSGLLRAGLTVSYSLGHAKMTSATATNESTGGMGIIPMVGYEMPLASGVFGGQFKYSYLGTRTFDDATGTLLSTTTGGSAWNLAVFYEKTFSPMLVGLALEYSGISAATSVTHVGTFSFTQLGVSSSKFTANLYGSYSLSEKLLLLPGFIYGMPSSAALSSASAIEIDVGVRYKF